MEQTYKSIKRYKHIIMPAFMVRPVVLRCKMADPTEGGLHRSHKAILEFLDNDGNELRATPRVIEANIDYAISTVRNRIRELEEWGLVEYYDEDNGIYQLSENGHRFLDGELELGEVIDTE